MLANFFMNSFDSVGHESCFSTKINGNKQVCKVKSKAGYLSVDNFKRGFACGSVGHVIEGKFCLSEVEIPLVGFVTT